MEKRTRNAFTMLELVMVIVVLGILASLAIPRMERDIRQEAADNILSAIRYTQHMALMDDVQMRKTAGAFGGSNQFRNRWHRSLWRIGFQGCSDNGMFYFVASDNNTDGNIDTGEEALDPTRGLPMNGVNAQDCESQVQNGRSPEIFVTKKYGISDPGGIDWSQCPGNVQHIAFDHMGRPHRGIRGAGNNYATYMQADCSITFNFDDASFSPFTITIQQETGHAFIVGQADS